MRKLYWFSARSIDSLGLTGIISWILLSIILSYAVYIFIPAKKELLDLEVEASFIKPRTTVTTITQSPADSFFSSLAKPEDIPKYIQTIFDVAKKRGIEINEVIYKNEKRMTDESMRYEMNFSVMAKYPEIKAFVVETLKQLPAVSLEQLTFVRNEVDEGQVSAQLRFTMYLVN